jgi:hypothetical protein
MRDTSINRVGKARGMLKVCALLSLDIPLLVDGLTKLSSERLLSRQSSGNKGLGSWVKKAWGERVPSPSEGPPKGLGGLRRRPHSLVESSP